MSEEFGGCSACCDYCMFCTNDDHCELTGEEITRYDFCVDGFICARCGLPAEVTDEDR